MPSKSVFSFAILAIFAAVTKKTNVMKIYKWLRGLMKASALTTVMFIMQACYGTPSMYDIVDIPLSGYVIDKDTGQPLKGICLDASHTDTDYDHVIVYTDENGYFELMQWGNIHRVSSLTLEVKDMEGNYKPFDTLVMSDTDLTALKIKLESNQ